MKKALAILLASMLLLAVCGVSSADANPNQVGDQGGAKAAELDKMLRERNNGPMNQAPYVATPQQPASVPPSTPQNYPSSGMPSGFTSGVPGSLTSGSSGGGGVSTGVYSTTDPFASTPGSGTPSGIDGTPIILGQEGSQFGQGTPTNIDGTPIILGQEGAGVTGQPGVVADPNITLLPAPAESSGGVQSLDWFGLGFDLINQNKNVQILDINTGVNWSATYINGKNHADVIPASAADGEALTRNGITGSYVRRPVVVTINGTRYAGSMYAVGHGETNYCNYFKGVMCIHFTGSQTHGSKQVDTDHQAAINTALKYSN